MANSTTICSTPVHVGDLVKLHLKVVEGDKERTQVFEGMIIGIRGRQENMTFRIRKVAAGNIGVERIFPVQTPWITKVELKKPGNVRRAKLYYVREKSARQVAQITQAQ
jgi:large subunit ribosomal protein L19